MSLWEWHIGKWRPVYTLILWYLRHAPGFFLKEYLRHGVVGHSRQFFLYTNDDGISFDLDLQDYIQKMIFCFQYYELEYVQMCKRFIPVGGTVLDVRAYIGQYALLASKLAGPQGRVYAFEPNEQILTRLRRNIEINAAHHVEVIAKAVGAENGMHAYYAGWQLGGLLAWLRITWKNTLASREGHNDG